MKNKFIITSILTFSLLVGCKPAAKAPTIANLVEYNLNQEQPEPKSPYTRQTATFVIDPTDADGYKIYNESFSSYGILILENKFEAIGVYSLTFQKFLLAPIYHKNRATITLQNQPYINGVLTINYEDNRIFLDTYGNILYDGPIADLALSPLSIEYAGGSIYAVVNTLDSTIIHEYLDDLTTIVVPAMKTEPEFKPGELFTTMREPLDEFGHPDYELVLSNSQNIVYTFDKKNNNMVASFAFDPMEYSFLSFVSNHIVTQRKILLSSDATVYDYVKAGDKFALFTGYIDVLTGETVNVDFPYIFDEVQPILDKDGHFTLLESSLIPITKAKTLDLGRRVILDKQLKEVVDLKGMTVTNFVAVQGGYFNTNNGTLFDENLNFIADLSLFSPTLMRDKKHIRVNYYGRSGIIKTNGRILFDFEFDYLSINIYDSKMFGAINNEYYVLNLATGEKTKIEGPASLFYGEVVHVRDLVNKKYTIYNPLGVVYSEEIDEAANTYTPTLNIVRTHSDKEAILITTKTEVGGVVIARYTMLASDPLPNLKSTTIGTEVNAPIPMGASVSDAFILKLGDNKVHQPNNGYGTVYFKFTPEEDGSYTLMTPLSVVIQLHSADENFENLVLVSSGFGSLTYSTYDASTNYVLTIAGGGLKYYLAHFAMND